MGITLKNAYSSFSYAPKRRVRGSPVFRGTSRLVQRVAYFFRLRLNLEPYIARCATDWDYPSVLFLRECCKSAPCFQEMAPPQTEETFARPGLGMIVCVYLAFKNSSFLVPVSAQPMTSPAFEQKSSPVLRTSNGSSPKKRYASSNDSRSPRPFPSQNPGLENVEPTTKPTPYGGKDWTAFLSSCL